MPCPQIFTSFDTSTYLFGTFANDRSYFQLNLSKSTFHHLLISIFVPVFDLVSWFCDITQQSRVDYSNQMLKDWFLCSCRFHNLHCFIQKTCT